MTQRLHPDIKALRAIDRALTELPDDAARRRVMEWVVAHGLRKTGITLDRFHWITGERDAA